MIHIIIQTNPDKIQTLSLMNIMTIMYYMILNHQVGNSRLDDTPKQRTLTKLTMYIMYIYICKQDKIDDSPAGKTGHMPFSAIQLIPGLCQVLSHGGGKKVTQRGNMMQKMVDAYDQLTNMGTL